MLSFKFKGEKFARHFASVSVSEGRDHPDTANDTIPPFSCIPVNPTRSSFLSFRLPIELRVQQSRVCISLSREPGHGGGAQFRKADFNSVSFYTGKEISSAALFEGRTATRDYENRVDGAGNTCENPKS